MVGVKLQWTIEDSFELKTKNIYKIKTALHIFKCHNRWCTPMQTLASMYTKVNGNCQVYKTL
jgi:hypothetical protein